MSAPLVLAGKYALLRRLGRGGMADVFLAKQTGLAGFEKLVVVKRTLRHLADDEAFKAMFLDEARTAADLRHPNVVDVYEIGEDRGRLFLTMEFLHGRDLGQVLRRCSKRRESPPLAISLQLIAGAATGLDYAHKKTALDGRPLNIIHRDISPQNIVVTYNGEPKLVDFGIARATTRDHETAAGELRGKVAYVAPEQIEGTVVDARADQFALGVVLFELTTLQPLFRRKRPLDSLTAILHDDIPRPSALVPGYPADLEALVLKMLHRRPEERFVDCGEVAEAVDELAERGRYRLSRRQTGRWLRRTFADEIEDDRSLAHMPTLQVMENTGGEDSPLPGLGAGGTRGLPDAPASSDVASSHPLRPRDGGEQDSDEDDGVGAERRDDEDDDDDEGSTTRVNRRPQVRHVEPPRLPITEGVFVGRQAECAEIAAAFKRGAPLVSLVGGHGVGKTRLAVEAARGMHEEGSVHARFVDLTECRTVEEIISAAAHALDVGLMTGAPLEGRAKQFTRALEALCSDGPGALLVLDAHPGLSAAEAEQLYDGWLHSAPGLRLLVSARHPLGVGLETAIKVMGLHTPPEDADALTVMASEAGQLFLATVKEDNPTFLLMDDQAAQVARALREVAGAPLAIELAATRLASLETPWELEADIATRQDLRPRLTEPLSQAVDQAVAWALDSLPPLARRICAQAAAFSGGFSVALAERVFFDEEGKALEKLEEHLDLLRARALLRAWEPEGLGGDLRFAVVGSLRSRLVERLDPDEHKTLQRRRADALLTSCLDYARNIDGPGGVRMFARLAAETENLVDVLASALRTVPRTPQDVGNALRATLALDPVLTARGFTDRQLGLMDEAIASGREFPEVDPLLLAMALEARADAFKSRGELERARADYEEALVHASESKDAWFIGIVHRNLADVDILLDNIDEALAHCQEAQVLFQQIGDRHFEARVHLTMGRALLGERKLEPSVRHLATALDIFRHVGDRRFEGRAISLIAKLRDEQGQHERAVELYQAALQVHREVDDRRQRARTLIAQGALLRRLRRTEEAADRLRRARRLSRSIGNRASEGAACYQTALLAGSKGELDKMVGWLERARDILLECGEATTLLAVNEELKKLSRRP